jgi:hypothetical protein
VNYPKPIKTVSKNLGLVLEELDKKEQYKFTK